VRWLCQLFKAALCSTDSTHMPETSGRIHAWITRVLISHAGPRPWIGRWPPPARALAGRKVGNEMRMKRGIYVQTIRWLFVLALTVVGVHACAATSWARPAVTVSRGDPDEPEAPVPGPTKAGAAVTASSSAQASRSPYTTEQMRNSVRHVWSALVMQMLRLRI